MIEYDYKDRQRKAVRLGNRADREFERACYALGIDKPETLLTNSPLLNLDAVPTLRRLAA